ncbi:MAG: hypothetical protein V3U72_03330 [Candidatus Aenigmarchaeota archaeon]
MKNAKLKTLYRAINPGEVCSILFLNNLESKKLEPGKSYLMDFQLYGMWDRKNEGFSKIFSELGNELVKYETRDTSKIEPSPGCYIVTAPIRDSVKVVKIPTK